MKVKKTVLFICTGNACRSQMAEAMLRHLGGERFEALSAGSQPAGFVHPLALATLASLEIPHADLESKSWDVFVDTQIDAAITLCDDAAKQACPVFPGAGIVSHWPLPDPTCCPGTPDEQFEFCTVVAKRLTLKIERLVTLDFDELNNDAQNNDAQNKNALQHALDALAV